LPIASAQLTDDGSPALGIGGAVRRSSVQIRQFDCGANERSFNNEVRSTGSANPPIERNITRKTCAGKADSVAIRLQSDVMPV